MKPSKDELKSFVKLFGFSLLLLVFLMITISLGKGDSNPVIEAVSESLIPYPGPLISASPGTLPPYPWPPVYPTLAPGFHATEMAISYATQTAWYFESIKTPTIGMEENKAYPGWRKYVQGPLCFYDPIADFTLWLEPGWTGESYPEGGVIYIGNFHPEEIRYDHGTALNLPKNATSLGIWYYRPDKPLTAEQLTRDSINTLENNESSRGITIHGPYEYKPGKFDGFAYSLYSDGYVIAINLDLGERGILSTEIRFTEEEASALSGALVTLASFDLSSAQCQNKRPVIIEPPALPLSLLTGLRDD